jgi:hypothetical protein
MMSFKISYLKYRNIKTGILPVPTAETLYSVSLFLILSLDGDHQGNNVRVQ